MYSQNNEEQIILDYFKDYTGTLLDIGANDGITLSNSFALINRGWSAELIEPSKTAFGKLSKLHADNMNVIFYNIAMSDVCGIMEFYESGTHLNKGDTALLSTLSIKDKAKWDKTTDFSTVSVECYDWKKFIANSTYKQFDFISIDAEGTDYVILSQIDLKQVGCKLICVEHNGNDIDKYIKYCRKFGMKEIHRNNENLIVGL